MRSPSVSALAIASAAQSVSPAPGPVAADERAVAEARALVDPVAELVAEPDACALADAPCLACLRITVELPWLLWLALTASGPACIGTGWATIAAASSPAIASPAAATA